jgi:hypothetical protein
MRSMLLIVSLLADPIPTNIRDYFESQEQQRTAATKKLTARQSDLETNIKFETERVRLGQLKAQLREVTSQLEDASRATFHVPLSSYPKPKTDTVGELSGAIVLAVVDNDTVLARTSRGPVLFTGIPTKELRIRKPFATPGAWLVTADTIADAELLKIAINSAPHPITVTPIPPSTLANHRKAYDAARKRQ